MRIVRLFCLLSLVAFCTHATFAQQAATPAEPPAVEAPVKDAGPPPPGTLLDGTPVKLKLAQNVSSADAHVGDHVAFEVLEEVDVDHVPVILKGANAIATVTEAEHKKSMGRAGKLNINIDSVRLADNQSASLRAVKDAKGGGHVGAMTGAIVATSIIFFPAAPLFLFIHGKDITIPQGTEITAFVQGDMHLDMAKFAPTGGPAATTTAASSTASLAIESNVPNSDIEVDGNFVGNTPSTISLAAGKHDITVKKAGYQPWTRSMMVTSGSMHLDAELVAASVVQPAQPATPAAATPPSPAAQ
jgi:hypothetical protein